MIRRELSGSPAAERRAQTRALLSWYDSHRRELPWREDSSPYHVWLSEIMLQQTRVEAVVGYYRRFIAALPDIASLAAADEETVLKLWEGLGYYSRARSLQRAAVMVMEQYRGKLPPDPAELRKLPGIGEYTSAAIASISFGAAEPAVDGNLLRIYARAALYRENIRTPAAASAARAYFKERMTSRPGDFNQALMDLGATVCTPPPRRPDCASCPWSAHCASLREDPSGETAAELPVMPDKKARRKEHLTVLMLYMGNRILLRKRPPKGLLAGLYEFPNLPGELSGEEVTEAVRSMGLSPLRVRGAGSARHIFTHKEWEMSGYEILLADGPVPAGLIAAGREELGERYAIPSAFARYVEKLSSIVVE